MAEIVLIPVDVIKRFMMDVFTGVGIPEDEATISRDVLIAADIRGIDSHGVARLKYYYDRIKLGVHLTETKMEIVKETETTALVDGHHGVGHVISFRCMNMAIDKARFRRPVVPGDTVHYHVEKMRSRGRVWRFKAQAIVDGNLVAEAEVSAVIVDTIETE